MDIVAPIILATTIFVGGVTFFAEPHSIRVEHISVTSALEDQGYKPETVARLLEDDIHRILLDSGMSHDATRQMEFGYDTSGLHKLAEVMTIDELVRGMHEALGWIDGRVRIFFYEKEPGKITAEVDQLDVHTANELRAYQISETDPDDLLHEVAILLTRMYQPYVYAMYLYSAESSLSGSLLFSGTEESADYRRTRDFIKAHLVQEHGAGEDGSDDDHLADNHLFFNLLGVIFAKEGDPVKATKAFLAAIRVNPESPLAYVNLGWLLSRQGSYEAAIERFKLAERLETRDADHTEEERVATQLYWAATLVRMGRFEEALERLDIAEQMAPDLADIYILRAMIVDVTGSDKERVEALMRRSKVARWKNPIQQQYAPL